ncbi:42514_t:CDS:2, partial [Gigaspora margarita]
MENIDDTLQINEMTWAELQKHKKLMEFLNLMPLEEFNSLNFLPDPIPSIDDSNHYSSFNSLYGNEMNEDHCSSLLLNQEGQERGPNNLYTHKNINGWVECMACGKWQCLYSLNSVDKDEELQWQLAIQNFFYTCGDQIQLCYWCGAMDGLLELPTALTDRFKKVYPCCMICKESGKDHFTQFEIKTSKSKKRPL